MPKLWLSDLLSVLVTKFPVGINFIWGLHEANSQLLKFFKSEVIAHEHV